MTSADLSAMSTVKGNELTAHASEWLKQTFSVSPRSAKDVSTKVDEHIITSFTTAIVFSHAAMTIIGRMST